MTKGTPFQLFVADPTRSGLAALPDDLVFVDDLPVRGRQGRVRLWGLAEDDGRPRASVRFDRAPLAEGDSEPRENGARAV